MCDSNSIRKSSPVRFTLTLTLAVLSALTSAATVASAQAVYPSWSYTGSLNTVRRFHTTTLLPNDMVLVVGGADFDNCSMGSCPSLKSAELYDPATGTWISTGSLNIARNDHTATLLLNGKVLVVGGYPTNDAFQSAELFDPATGTWSLTGNINTGRANHMAALLPNGLVLIAGGTGRTGNTWNILGSAELYDPATGTWTNTGSLNTARSGTATLLPNGKVLVAGGFSRYDCPDGCKVLNSAELYDPATKIWSNTGNLNTARAAHTATLLHDGKLLVAGGLDGIDGYTRTADLYDPATGKWSQTGSLNTVRVGPAVLLADGKVLIAGGVDHNSNAIGSAELYDPTTGKFGVTAYLNTSRVQHHAVLLPNGKVLVAGGYTDPTNSLKTAELYEPNSTLNINMIDEAQFFVHQHYIDFLGRTPDAAGLNFWQNQITSCGSDQQCIELKRINVSAAFFLSIEFQETGYFVYRVNKAAHGNLPGEPVPIKFDEFQPQTLVVGYGVVVGTAGWEQVLESNKLSYLGAYEVEPEDRHTAAYPTSMTPTAFVDALFANAEVTPSSSDRVAAVNEFGVASTTEDLLARTRALRRVADNPTLKQQELNRAFVLMQYFGYLRRNPNDPPELTVDFQGYNFWLTKLNQFDGNFVGAEMVKAFLVSTEYRQRFGQP